MQSRCSFIPTPRPWSCVQATGGGLLCDSTGQQGDFSPVMVTVVPPPMLPALGDTPVMVNTAVMMSEVWTRVYC